MKILQVNCVYRKGSTGKITADIHEELLKQGIDSVVCYGRGELISEPNVYKVCSEWYSKLNNLWSRITGIMYGGLSYSTKQLIRVIEREKPDVVHLQCINGYFVNIYQLVKYLNKHRIRTLLTLHAEFMYTANCGISVDCEKWMSGCSKCPRLKQETKSVLIDGTHRSWQLMKDAFDGFGKYLIVSSVSTWLENRATQSPILSQAEHTTVYNGLDTNIFKCYVRNQVLQKYNLDPNAKIVFHATPSFTLDLPSIKGGYYVCKMAELMPDITFVVAGPYASDVKVPSNVKLLGSIANQEELAQLYSAADVTLLTSSRETFSMVTAESLCCGTPVVGFKAGGPESIAIPEYATFVDYADVSAMQLVLDQYLHQQWDKKEISDKSRTIYAREAMTDGYIQLYKQLISRI